MIPSETNAAETNSVIVGAGSRDTVASTFLEQVLRRDIAPNERHLSQNCIAGLRRPAQASAASTCAPNGQPQRRRAVVRTLEQIQRFRGAPGVERRFSVAPQAVRRRPRFLERLPLELVGIERARGRRVSRAHPHEHPNNQRERPEPAQPF